MFKELKVIKLIVFGGLLIAIISKINFSDNVIIELYTDKVSYSSNESVEIYTSTISLFSINREININNVSGKKVSSIDIELNNQVANINSLEKGMEFTNFSNYQLTNNLKSGLYFIEDKYPLIVKSKRKAEITIVYPYANNILYQPFNNSDAFSSNIKKTSLNRTASVDVYTKGITPFFEYLNHRYSVNYIADIDLENLNNYKDSKILILYGKLTCWTPKMKESFKSYISNKGNALLMSSYIANNVCWFDRKENNIIMYDNNSNAMKSWVSYNGNSSDKTAGISYANGGYSSDSSYKLVNDGHSILKGIKGGGIGLKANLYSSPPIKWYDDLPRVDLDSLNFYKGEIIAYGEATFKENQKSIKGIFVLQPDSTSGKIISLGTEDWCLKENYQENEQVQLITKNAIDYLLK